jgi:hypothetical protein
MTAKITATTADIDAISVTFILLLFGPLLPLVLEVDSVVELE